MAVAAHTRSAICRPDGGHCRPYAGRPCQTVAATTPAAAFFGRGSHNCRPYVGHMSTAVGHLLNWQHNTPNAHHHQRTRNTTLTRAEWPPHALGSHGSDVATNKAALALRSLLLFPCARAAYASHVPAPLCHCPLIWPWPSLPHSSRSDRSDCASRTPRP